MRPKHAALAVVAATAIALAPFFALAAFNHPISDDYCIAATSREMGPFGTVAHYYRTWAGMFFGVFIQSVNPLVFDSVRGYQTLTWFLLVVSAASIAFAIRSFFPRISRTHAALLSAAALVIYVTGMPHVQDGFFWMAAAVGYQLGAVLALTAVSAAARAARATERRRQVLWGALAAAAASAAVGSNIPAMMILVTGGIVAVVAPLPSRSTRWPWWLLLVSASATAAVVALAPGNGRRLEHMQHRRDIWWSLSRSITQTVQAIQEWVSHAPLLLATAAIVLWAAASLPADGRPRPTVRQLVMLAAAALAVATSALFPSLWLTGDGPPGRVLNVVYWYFTFAWFGIAYLVGQRLAASDSARSGVTAVPQGVLAVLFAFAVFTGDVRNAYGDLIRGRALQYHREYEHRYAMIRSAKAEGARDVVLPRILARPHILGSPDADLHPDPGHYINWCTADYLGLRSLRAGNPDAPIP